MEDNKKNEEINELEGFEFISKDAHDSLFYAFRLITNSEDELRDLIYYLKHGNYIKSKFQDDDFKHCVDKMLELIEELDILYDDVANVYMKRDLLIKEKE